MTAACRWLVGGLLAAPAAPAFAHAAIEGVGSFYNGLLHPFLSPTHAMVLVALGLLLGQQGNSHARRALPAFAASLAAALALSGWLRGLPLATAMLAVGAVTGLLTAGAFRLPRALTLALSVATGILVGLDSGPTGEAGFSALVMLAGVWLSAGFMILWCYALADVFRRQWQKIGVRVAGSWISAISIMLLALSTRQ